MNNNMNLKSGAMLNKVALEHKFQSRVTENSHQGLYKFCSIFP